MCQYICTNTFWLLTASGMTMDKTKTRHCLCLNKDSLMMAPQECQNMKERKFCIKCVWSDGLNSSPRSQKPAIGPYRESNKLRHLSSLFLHNPLNILFTAKLRVFQVDSFLQISPQKPCIHFSFPHMCHATHPSPPQGMDKPNNIW